MPTWPSLVTVVLLSVNDYMLSWVNEAPYVDQTKHDVFYLFIFFVFFYSGNY